MGHVIEYVNSTLALSNLVRLKNGKDLYSKPIILLIDKIYSLLDTIGIESVSVLRYRHRLNSSILILESVSYRFKISVSVR